MRKQHVLTIVLIVLSVLTTFFIVVAFVANWLRSPEDFYLLPRNADDWSGWGTGMGALGTTGALIYAAMKFRSDAEEQRNLRLDRDAEARADAKPLEVTVSLSYPTEDLRDVSGLRLKLNNLGKQPFTNIQVKIPDVPAQITSGQTAPLPPLIWEDNPGGGREDEVWTPMTAQPYQVDKSQQLWLCGDVPPGSMISLYIEFAEIQDVQTWGLNPTKDYSKAERKGRIAVIFDDYKGRTWIRSTEGRRPLQRLWPESFIAEQKA
jgi:hypothetical protein